jgi:hypothetical protein
MPRIIIVKNNELVDPFVDLDIYETLVIADTGHIYTQNKSLSIKTFPLEYFDTFSKDTNRPIITMEDKTANFNSESYEEVITELVKKHIDVVSFVYIKRKVYNKDVRQEFNMGKSEVDSIFTLLLQAKILQKVISARYYISNEHKEMVEMELNNYRG